MPTSLIKSFDFRSLIKFFIKWPVIFLGFGKFAKCSLLKIAGRIPANIITDPIIIEIVLAPRTGSGFPVSGFENQFLLYIIAQHQGAINHGT